MTEEQVKEFHWISQDGNVVRCNSPKSYGPFSASYGCNQQIERLHDENLRSWKRRRDSFIRGHQHATLPSPKPQERE